MNIYKVTVTLSRLEETVRSPEWVRGGPDGKRDGERTDDDAYGYTPQTIETKRVNRTIYEQEVGDLDLQAVIVAVNQMTK